MNLSRLKRDFYAAFPTKAAPHGNFEAELLLAGKKPVGWIGIPPASEIERAKQSSTRFKSHHDFERLNKAVADGKLKSMDGPAHEFGGDTVRYFAQPNQEETMRRVIEIQKKLSGLNENMKPGETLTTAYEGLYVYPAALGYRKRDIAIWTIRRIFPGMPGVDNEQEYHDQLLESCGIDPADFRESIKRDYDF